MDKYEENIMQIVIEVAHASRQKPASITDNGGNIYTMRNTHNCYTLTKHIWPIPK